MKKKNIKIKYVDFWDHWDQENNFISNILKERYNVIISDNPDYVFFSNFNEFHNHMDYNDCVKIFYTQENICPDFNFCDYGIGFEYINYLDRYIRFPIHFIEERYGIAWRRMLDKHKNISENKEEILSRKFCSFVVSNGKAEEIRKIFFDKLCKYKKISSGGKYLNNIGMPNGVKNKFEFNLQHKFSICFENSSHPGYCTEKLIESFAAKNIPIYWGDTSVSEFFNKEAFINISDFENLEDAINKIIEIDNSDDLYIKMLEKPALKSEYANIWDDKQKELRIFLFNIFDQPYEQAFRRNNVFWGAIYTERYKKMRDIYKIVKNNMVMRLFNQIYKYLKNIYKLFKKL